MSDQHSPSGRGSSNGLQVDFTAWAAATSDPSALVLGIPGFSYADLFSPERLADLSGVFEGWFKERDAAAHARFDAYRTTRGVGMKPEAISEALLAASPWVSRFVIELFGVSAEAQKLVEAAHGRDPLWLFKKEFAKKRLFKASAGKAWTSTPELAARTARRALVALGAPADVLQSGSDAEEDAVARATMLVFEVDDTARKVQKAGGATWTDELAARAARVRAALLDDAEIAPVAKAAAPVAGSAPTTAEDGALTTFVLDAIEAWLNARRVGHGAPGAPVDHHDRARRWPTLHAPATVDHMNLVQLRRADPALPELFVGPDHERRDREGFVLTDRRMNEREVESEVDYCLYCHDRDKDSCTKGLRDNKTGALKPNPLGVELAGCPLKEKISEMHLMRKHGDAVAALALVCIDNPMAPGTGHRICNDCMKACVFQKQEPVNIPQIETAVLTDVLALPWGFEIYGLLSRWNPLNVDRPHPRPYVGKNVLIVGLGPAGYTLAHHLANEGFACVAIDGLKIEPLPLELTGDETRPPRPIKDFEKMYLELDERVLLGFGGVSEYGITVRWDKNFLTVLYVTLARQRLLKIHGACASVGPSTSTTPGAWGSTTWPSPPAPGARRSSRSRTTSRAASARPATS